jgi:ELWxxDGT repeat protein
MPVSTVNQKNIVNFFNSKKIIIMKWKLLLAVFALLNLQKLKSQVTQINSNNSLHFTYPLSNNKAIYVSGADSTIWITDGTLAGTISLSASIKFLNSIGSVAFLNGKYIFSATSAASGAELYITDGTIGGTVLLKDINPGVPGSFPDDGGAVLNGFLYFTAVRPAEGRELWRTDGTTAGTTLVKDIVTGPSGSNTAGNYNLFSSGTYLLFAALTPSSGLELWTSDGSSAGTVLLKDINTGNAGADSSSPKLFYPLNGKVLFVAKNATTGEEIWKTDGTSGGTTILADINPGPGSSTSIDLFPGFSISIFSSFHTFNNHAYFIASDGNSTGELWSTDGTGANTILLKNIVQSSSIPFILITDAVDLSTKFIFPVSDQASRSELWESDGTTGGTKLFKSFDNAKMPFIFPPFSTNGISLVTHLFQGNKFFFMASTVAEGNELWISDGTDGTVAHTSRIKDINAGSPDGINTSSVSYTYTASTFFFPADDGTQGIELWKSDGTLSGTSIVADIITGLGSSEPTLSFFIVNGKVLFEANNGDDPSLTDLYAVDGSFTPLPVTLAEFTVAPKAADALLRWTTLQELNSKVFNIQRSFNGLDFENIGSVAANGTTALRHAYSFTDPGVMNSGKGIVYYRLQTADLDGKMALSTVISLRLKNTGKWNVTLLSNPISDNVKLVLSGVSQKVTLSVTDMNGKKLYSNSIAAVNGQLSIPAANLPHGTYLLVAETGGEIKTLHFVK